MSVNAADGNTCYNFPMAPLQGKRTSIPWMDGKVNGLCIICVPVRYQ